MKAFDHCDQLMVAEFSNFLANKFNVIGMFNLANYYADMNRLKDDLLSIKKESFDHLDKIIFLHYEPEFHQTIDSYGFIIYNLSMILYDVDISSCFTLMITNYHGIDKKLAQLNSDIGRFDTPIPVVYCPFYNGVVANPKKEITDIQCNFDQIKKKYSLLNYRPRSHRRALMSLILNRGLDQHGLISFCTEYRS